LLLHHHLCHHQHSTWCRCCHCHAREHALYECALAGTMMAMMMAMMMMMMTMSFEKSTDCHRRGHRCDPL
jgi:hypothetical protein